MKVAIYGAGAMGTVLGAFLTKSGVAVDLITRNEAHANGLKENGAKISCVAEDKEFYIKVNALLPSEITEKYDLVFLMTKQRENAKNAQNIKEFLSDTGVVITTQNGLPEQSLAEILGGERVLGGVCSFGANFCGGGEVEMTSKLSAMQIEIGCYKENHAALEKVASVLKKVEESFQIPEFLKITQNLMGVRWNKLAINAAFSSLSAVTGKSFGYIAKRRKTAKIALGIMRECFAVQKALGIPREPMQGRDLEKLFGGSGFFQTQKALFLLPIAMKKHKKLRSGMLADIKKGRKCEIEFIAGAVSERGKSQGVETPLCDTCVEIVRGIENGLYELTEKNAAFF